MAITQVQANLYWRKFGRGKGGSWMARWKDQATERWRAITAGKTKREAEFVLGRVREALLRGEDPAKKNEEKQKPQMLSYWIQEYYKTPKFLAASPRYRGEFISKMAQIEAKLPNVLFDKLTKNQIFTAYLSLKNEASLCHETIRKYHFNLCAVGDHYTEATGLPNPIRHIGSFAKVFSRQASTRDINFLQPEELERLLIETRRSKNRMLYSFVRFLTHTGMRRSEALKLKWTDVDFSGGFINIRNSKNGKARRIPLEPEAVETLKELSQKVEFVFVGQPGFCKHKDSLLKPLQRAAKRAEINKRVDLHTLRHSYGSNKIRAGWGLKKVSMILGHSDISITSNVYTHLLDGDLKIRDDFRFDNPGEEENIDRVSQTFESFETLVQRLVTGLVESGVSPTQLESSIDSLTQSRATSVETARSAEISRESLMSSKTPRHATLVLHSPVLGQKKGLTPEGVKPKISNNSDYLSNGGSDGTRTHGLRRDRATL